MEYPKQITPIPGEVYKNRNGQLYVCMESFPPNIAVMRRQSDSWTLNAHEVRQYEDGSIEWDDSAGGHWT